MAEHVTYYDYEPTTEVRCPRCDWSGVAGEHQEYFRDVLDVRCAECDEMILVVPYPTESETEAAAASGNERAAADLVELERHRAERQWMTEATYLTEPSQLPDLDGDELVIDWDIVDDSDGRPWQALRHETQEIWREPAYYESIDRFKTIFAILRERYGGRLSSLTPTPHSEVWLYGDRLSAPRDVHELNASLRTDDHNR